MADEQRYSAELVRSLWMERRLGREVLGQYMKSKSERLNDGSSGSAGALRPTGPEATHRDGVDHDQ